MEYTLSDELLARRAAAGRSEYFELLLRRYRNRVYRICFRMAGNAEDAEDWAVECLVSAYRQLGRYDPERPFAPWLTRVVVDRCLRQASSRANRRERTQLGLDETSPKVLSAPDRSHGDALPMAQLIPNPARGSACTAVAERPCEAPARIKRALPQATEAPRGLNARVMAIVGDRAAPGRAWEALLPGRRALRRVARGADRSVLAVARFLSSRWEGAQSRGISARTRPTLDLPGLSDAHRRLLAAPPETEIRTQDSRALTEALALLLSFPVGAVDLRSEELWLVGGRPVEVNGVMVGALHYDWEGVRVSLFQVGARTLSPPTLRRVLSRSNSFLVEKVGGLTSVAWSFGRTSCVMVAESVPAPLMVQFAFHAREKLKCA